MLQAGGVKIWRPRQIYLGAGQRDYIDIQGREEKELAAPDTLAAVAHGGDSKRNELATYRNERGDIMRPKL